MAGVYQIYNKETDKRYIGSSIAFKNCNGFLNKLNCTFIRITKEEYKIKVSGEK